MGKRGYNAISFGVTLYNHFCFKQISVKLTLWCGLLGYRGDSILFSESYGHC